jgi:hypothetical protein
MPTSPAELLHDWHDFYILAGAASATLVGLMFVAASIASSIITEEHEPQLRVFFTPTVSHFATVLLTSLWVTIPTHTWLSLGGAIGAGGLAGSIHCGIVVVHLIVRRKFKLELSDQLFYALVPVLGYVLLLVSAAFLFIRPAAGADLVAAALLTLLLAGIRNAWDMMIFLTIKVPTAGGPPPPPSPDTTAAAG